MNKLITVIGSNHVLLGIHQLIKYNNLAQRIILNKYNLRDMMEDMYYNRVTDSILDQLPNNIRGFYNSGTGGKLSTGDFRLGQDAMRKYMFSNGLDILFSETVPRRNQNDWEFDGINMEKQKVSKVTQKINLKNNGLIFEHKHIANKFMVGDTEIAKIDPIFQFKDGTDELYHFENTQNNIVVLGAGLSAYWIACRFQNTNFIIVAENLDKIDGRLFGLSNVTIVFSKDFTPILPEIQNFSRIKIFDEDIHQINGNYDLLDIKRNKIKVNNGLIVSAIGK
jgi:hypothetical protein